MNRRQFLGWSAAGFCGVTLGAAFWRDVFAQPAVPGPSPYGPISDTPDENGLRLITPQRVVAPFLELEGHDRSEITGPAFSPTGDRLYFSSQRGVNNEGIGVTFEVRGPFRI